VLSDQRMQPVMPSMPSVAGADQPPDHLHLRSQCRVIFGQSSPMNSTRTNLYVSRQAGHSARRPLHSNDQVLTPKRARHPISSPVAGEPAGAQSVGRSPKGDQFRGVLDPPAAAAAEPPRQPGRLGLKSLVSRGEHAFEPSGLSGRLSCSSGRRVSTPRNWSPLGDLPTDCAPAGSPATGLLMDVVPASA